MATGTYVVRLIDCAETGGVGADRAAVGQLLATWYRSVCATASSAAMTWSADVQWLTAPQPASPSQDAGSPQTINMLIFYVPTPQEGVIRLHPNWRGQAQEADGDTAIWGTTVLRWTPPGAAAGHRTGTLGIAEVYTRRCRTTQTAASVLNLARTGFHETMHNQTVRNGSELHSGRAGFAADIPAGDAPTGSDLQLMSGALRALVPQWLDGFQAWRTNAADPFGGI